MKDADRDGYGDQTPPSGVISGTDCQDGVQVVHPEAAEVCDWIDNDCDGLKDEADPDLTRVVDSDHDGLTDWEEVQGVDGDDPPNGVPDLLIQNAPYSADCHKPDAFLEVDYMSCLVPGTDLCPWLHVNDRPSDDDLRSVERAFDTHGGIHLRFIVDGAVPHLSNFDLLDADIRAYYDAYFGTAGDSTAVRAAKRRVMRYALFAHGARKPAPSNDHNLGFAVRWQSPQCSSWAFVVYEYDIRWDAVAASKYPWDWDGEYHSLVQLNTMHELGHTLGLLHGGSELNDRNCKPNYLSVMSYSRSHNARGVAWKIAGKRDGDPVRLGETTGELLDYSHAALPASSPGNQGGFLSEDALDESLPSGIGASSAGRTVYCASWDSNTQKCTRVLIGPTNAQMDWNGDGSFQAVLGGMNINLLPAVLCGGSPAQEILDGFDDWGYILNHDGAVCKPLPVPSSTPSGYATLTDPYSPVEQTAEGVLNGLLGAADVDADGIENIDDNCPGEANAIQIDIDGDDFGDPCDCLPADGQVWGVPSEANQLTFSDGRTLTWVAPGNPGGNQVTYDTLRAGSPGDFVSATHCVESDDGTDTTAVDDEVPSSGEVSYFLVRARSGCANGGGSLGTDSGGTARLGGACD